MEINAIIKGIKAFDFSASQRESVKSRVTKGFQKFACSSQLIFLYFLLHSQIVFESPAIESDRQRSICIQSVCFETCFRNYRHDNQKSIINAFDAQKLLVKKSSIPHRQSWKDSWSLSSTTKLFDLWLFLDVLCCIFIVFFFEEGRVSKIDIFGYVVSADIVSLPFIQFSQIEKSKGALGLKTIAFAK